MSTLWNPRKALNQPPGYGRIGQHSTPAPKADAAAQAAQAVRAAHAERKHVTRKLGARAVVRG